MALSLVSGDHGIALTFDDVLLVPGASEIMPGEADVASKVTKSISVSIPVLSSAMDTVTEGAACHRCRTGGWYRGSAPQPRARGTGAACGDGQEV